MATWLSTHGIGAIKDSNSSFAIVADKGSALVKPTDPNALSGWIHFTIPSPPVNNPNLKVVAIDFSSQSANVEAVAVYLANIQKYKEEGLQRGQSFTLSLPSNPQVLYQGKGISVSILVQFDNISSNLRLQSVGIQV
ncbi:uncharacterized protein F4812DRAFT_128337 [Daldinia caldariorum]|uniref:uncharacterized protein n=1 Tax=Daldinia caldariorum TaxID=326644 RepID=UPI0020081A68|nr:uncharacterized protein F4812DRAFT_128337 [Daldinia caldariorum]KAI1465548.1 hypothetical protein F4812DRAFT_128337 [Daldinia caldariorum]